LLSIASAKPASDAHSQPLCQSRAASAVRVSAPRRSAARTNACSESSANKPASTFLRSVIQATDSTWIGCTANSAPASHAPGTPSAAASRNSSTASAAWSSTLSMW
jgi:hypothetical protein